ncbi:MAG: DUF4924 family protein [Bacteroidaceae bacterium]|nr:DUF4924 family protein [Bacteroidales bacterium]MBQ8257736.1 DUF4924 family protein [Bacteroidaceae bacterium]
MIISRELRKRNIAEYLLYMWQVEDLLRAYELSMEKITAALVAPHNLPADGEKEMVEWYENLAEMMRMEGVKEKGHLQINKNVIINLTDLHSRLLKSPKVPFYSAAYYKALPFIVEFRAKSDGKDKCEIENCFDALYMLWLMRLQKREINKETAAATAEISKFISMLSLYYKEEEEGKLNLDNEE